MGRKLGRFVTIVALLVAVDVRRSHAQSADEREAYDEAIAMEGLKEHRDLIRAHLDALKKLPTGRKLIAAIHAAAGDSKTLLVAYRRGDARGGAPDHADNLPRRFEVGADGVLRILEAGPGNSGLVYYDPRFVHTNKDTDVQGGIGCLTPEIILGHEL
ncbi:MAG: hypothetical protein ACAI25_03490, partial [Planctomycetota bacterium]